ncbi:MITOCHONDRIAL GROUP I INTRON SPLICING FACTOR CCM1 [Salix koriyanagi]|uniref:MITOCHONDRIAL GROUP I INTRON SPLICING FACTOR CCM1 n=1 Tax=Salix koriyanagi TaxID=2511006 RepID=A0A9Q0WQB6_9ROSI|nr:MITOCHONDRIAL GROUP I INTRON SPLICING FACTOR CCM1 [Salix koriyanagi]
MNIRHDYKLVLDFFDWACLRREANLEARCIIVQIAVASKDLKLARDLICAFWTKPNLDFGVSFTHFVDRLIYTYKEWGSDPPYSCNLYLTRLSDNFDRLRISIKVFNEFPQLRGNAPDVVSYSTVINGYCRGGELQKVLKLIQEMQMKGLKPNLYTYNSIILLLCKSGKVDDAEKVLREMINQGIVS